jgi:hypothetical protein
MTAALIAAAPTAAAPRMLLLARLLLPWPVLPLLCFFTKFIYFVRFGVFDGKTFEIDITTANMNRNRYLTSPH